MGVNDRARLKISSAFRTFSLVGDTPIQGDTEEALVNIEALGSDIDGERISGDTFNGENLTSDFAHRLDDHSIVDDRCSEETDPESKLSFLSLVAVGRI
jgi:hypothetical protein